MVRATLEDGSRVVIASVRFHLSVLTLEEWEELRTELFGDLGSAG